MCVAMAVKSGQPNLSNNRTTNPFLQTIFGNPHKQQTSPLIEPTTAAAVSPVTDKHPAATAQAYSVVSSSPRSAVLFPPPKIQQTPCFQQMPSAECGEGGIHSRWLSPCAKARDSEKWVSLTPRRISETIRRVESR